jgi:alkanesulfonate monooxygenase SsuD/methylene tetrahydromethanopterin reductase-like flavin-dependent oxidoreductase (luciferase family)
LPPVQADLHPVQVGGPPIWTGGASEAAMRRASGAAALAGSRSRGCWTRSPTTCSQIARRAPQDAGRDPDALKTGRRINLEPGTSVDSLVGKLTRFTGAGIDEALMDAFVAFPCGIPEAAHGSDLRQRTCDGQGMIASHGTCVCSA